jgi:3-oxoacyl-[acyl-carrier protein] reductase
MSEADFDAVIQQNLKSVFNCSKAVLRQMMKQRYGRIVNVASIAGVVGNVGQTTRRRRPASSVTRAMARSTACGTSRSMPSRPAMSPPRSPAACRRSRGGHRPAHPAEWDGGGGRRGDRLLASDEASYVTGQIVAVDGDRRIAFLRPARE